MLILSLLLVSSFLPIRSLEPPIRDNSPVEVVEVVVEVVEEEVVSNMKLWCSRKSMADLRSTTKSSDFLQNTQ